MTHVLGPSPQVSVVIPTYNRADLLGKAIESVLDQSYRDLELIVVDDASTDGTPQVVRGYGDPRVRYIVLQENRRQGVAMNAGIANARGDVIAFLDSDDTWLPAKLERQLAFVETMAPPAKPWICYTRLLTETGADRGIVPARGKRAGESVAEYLFCNNGVMSTITLMLPADLARRVRFQTELHAHYDWDFCLRLEAVGAAFLYLPEPLSRWNMTFRHDRTSTNTPSGVALQWLDRHRAMMSPKAQRAYLAKTLTRSLRQEGKRLLALRNIGSALAARSISVAEGFELVVTALITDGIHTFLWAARDRARELAREGMRVLGSRGRDEA